MNRTGKGTKKPNLVFVFADQMRGMDICCTGNSRVITPNLDMLAQDGFMFRNAVSCFPVCTPYRGCLISGRYPTTTGVMDNDIPLPIDGKGFGHVLKENGYRTGWVGKWHLFGPIQAREAFIPPGEHRHGFDDLWAGVNCSHKYFNNFYYFNDHPEKVYFKGYEPDVQTDIAMEFIARNKREPFALFLSWGPPHDPYHEVPEQWKTMYDEEGLTFRANVRGDEGILTDSLPGNLKAGPGFDVLSFYDSYAEEKHLRAYPDKKVLRDYYAAITALDYNIGRLRDHIKKLGLDADTIFVFTSDHGDMMYSQRTIQKNHPWEESVNVPFIIKYEGVIKPGGDTLKPFNTVDIMPTILELMGIEIPDFAEGDSFAPMLSGGGQKLPEAAYIMCAWPWIIPEWRGIRTERYTYIESPDSPLMLYDNFEDPYQMNNLINKNEHKDLREELRGIYQKIRGKIGDPFEPWNIIDRKMEEIRKDWLTTYTRRISGK